MKSLRNKLSVWDSFIFAYMMYHISAKRIVFSLVFCKSRNRENDLKLSNFLKSALYEETYWPIPIWSTKYVAGAHFPKKNIFQHESLWAFKEYHMMTRWNSIIFISETEIYILKINKCGKGSSIAIADQNLERVPQIFCVCLITTEIANPLIPVIYPIHYTKKFIDT